MNIKNILSQLEELHYMAEGLADDIAALLDELTPEQE
jgi:hypothetical protein